jgi:cysteinyl-tRNA synthetase
MIEWAKSIEARHCYRLDSGLYFDTSTVPEYGRLARATTEAGESRIDPVQGKRNPVDFAIWRTTPPGETRQMEWDSPWGKGAPGWHLECSVMSAALLGHPFDIHTGGIDHREVHHPCEIAQNQAHGDCAHTGAAIWMHNNFLIDRRGKMSKSSGEFLRLQTLVDKGFHPLAYRLMCLQAHYRSELEFSWEGLLAAFTRLKRIVAAWERERTSAGLPDRAPASLSPAARERLDAFEAAVCDDLNTPRALTVFEDLLSCKGIGSDEKVMLISRLDDVLGLGLDRLTRAALRIRPREAAVTEAEIESTMAERREARAARDFARSDVLRDNLLARGVDVMDGDPIGWDWRIET